VCGVQVGRTPILTAARFSQDDAVCLLLQHEIDDDDMALEDFRLPDYVRVALPPPPK
jgi:ankyrin repeat protein